MHVHYSLPPNKAREVMKEYYTHQPRIQILTKLHTHCHRAAYGPLIHHLHHQVSLMARIFIHLHVVRSESFLCHHHTTSAAGDTNVLKQAKRGVGDGVVVVVVLLD